MKKRTALASIFLSASVCLHAGSANEMDYAEGASIQCKTSYSKDEWAACTYIAKSPDGSQPVTRDAQGFQMALPDWSWVRPLDIATVASAAAAPAEALTADATQGHGLMSEAEIIDFLKTHLGADPFGNPRRFEVKAQLAAAIKRRGIDFHFDPLSPFFNEASKYTGMDADLTGPLHDNYGPPTELRFLLGTWNLDIVGATTLFEKDGDLYRREASAAANTGTLTINPDGSYGWQATTPPASFRGQWRQAQPAEMRSQGGAGLVLLHAKGGWDWIVTQVRGSTQLTGDVIFLSYIDGRGLREIGSRQR